MPAANPLSDVSANGAPASGFAYQGGVTSNPGSLTSGAMSMAAQNVGGSANVSVGGLVLVSLGVLVVMHLLGFRFAFDVEVGRR